MAEPTLIDLVLLLRDPEVSRELGRALWAAFREVETFYNLDEQRATFRRFYLSEEVPTVPGQWHSGIRGLGPAIWRFIEKIGVTGPQQKEISSREQFVKGSFSSEWEGAEGTFSRTYDAEKIYESVRQGLLSETEHVGTQVIVTDQELTPPANWRYILWSKRVISIMPMDPCYWQMIEPDRIAVIKHRVRTACLMNVGRLLHLERCGNESCFLYGPVLESVLCLDGMVKLGQEHGLDELAGRGFEVLSRDPSVEQPIIKDPGQERWFYER